MVLNVEIISSGAAGVYSLKTKDLNDLLRTPNVNPHMIIQPQIYFHVSLVNNA